ncbi:hypothetical protein WMY93_024669 [Mugilogobius chulae]|uniref:Amyloid-beta A4 precursor protein-binding family A member 3 n=1 Tax=Mugilogobius chulae TaxID=88201 RepID=A0AAW0NCA8_9GOBI
MCQVSLEKKQTKAAGVGGSSQKVANHTRAEKSSSPETTHARRRLHTRAGDYTRAQETTHARSRVHTRAAEFTRAQETTHTRAGEGERARPAVMASSSGISGAHSSSPLPPAAAVEELDSFDPLEPPPLDWRSDSSSEGEPAEGLDSELTDSLDPSPAAADDEQENGKKTNVLEKSEASEIHEEGLEECSLNNRLTTNRINPFSRAMDSVEQRDKAEHEFDDLIQGFSKEISKSKMYKVMETRESEENLSLQKQEYQSDDACVEFETQASKNGNIFESELEGICAKTDAKTTDYQDSNRRESCDNVEDEDHSRIHSLLNQLQLKREEEEEEEEVEEERSALPQAAQSRPRPPSPDADETTGLLFSEQHQRDAVNLLQSSDLSGSLTGDVDAVVSVSFSQDDTRRFFGRYDKAPAWTLREDSFSSQPDDEEPEPVWMKLGEDPPEQEAAGGTEAEDAEPSYKDVPGPCDPEDLLDGVIFGAKYLGSTQIRSDRNPSTNARMTQAQEAVDRIKAPEGESQPMTEVDLFISTKRIKVLTADTQEAMMDHSMQMISYIADIGQIVVLMARRKRKGQEAETQKKCLMVCHVFTSEDAQVIAQAIGQAFGVAYQQFLQVNGIRASDLKPGEYSHYLESQELYNGDLAHFSDEQNLKEVVITKPPGEMLGLAVVESGWGSILPTVVIANMLHGGPAERCGELSIGDRIMSVNGTSLVGLPISTCQNIIRWDIINTAQRCVRLCAHVCRNVSVSVCARIGRDDVCALDKPCICSLMRGGIAERGGIRVGHRIIEINGQSVVATSHDKIIQTLTNAVGEIHLKTMPASTYRLLTGQEQPVYL